MTTVPNNTERWVISLRQLSFLFQISRRRQRTRRYDCSFRCVF